MDLAFPPRCSLCHGSGPVEAAPFCRLCTELLNDERSEPACPRCAAAVAPHELSGRKCGDCRDRPLRVVETVRVGAYRGRLAHLIRTYKYRGREELGPVLGGWLAAAVSDAPWLDRVEAIVSVPTYWKHRLTRPFYAAGALASVVAKKTGLPHPPILRRVRGGPHQIGLSYTARQENVRGAFAMRRGVKLRNARLLLIDDVKTTGATIEECAKILRQAGAAEVYAAVVVNVDWRHLKGQAITMI